MHGLRVQTIPAQDLSGPVPGLLVRVPLGDVLEDGTGLLFLHGAEHEDADEPDLGILGLKQASRREKPALAKVPGSTTAGGRCQLRSRLAVAQAANPTNVVNPRLGRWATQKPHHLPPVRLRLNCAITR